LQEYISINPSFKTLSKDLQMDRYNHYCTKKQEKIKLVKEDRAFLISNPGANTLKGLIMFNMSSTKSKSFNDQNFSQISSNYGAESSNLKLFQNEGSTLIKNEQARLEKLKQKQVTF